MVRHLLKLIGIGVLFAFVFCLSPVVPLYVIIPATLTVCGVIIGSAIINDLQATR